MTTANNERMQQFVDWLDETIEDMRTSANDDCMSFVDGITGDYFSYASRAQSMSNALQALNNYILVRDKLREFMNDR